MTAAFISCRLREDAPDCAARAAEIVRGVPPALREELRAMILRAVRGAGDAEGAIAKLFDAAREAEESSKWREVLDGALEDARVDLCLR
jgi:hypothetical protein